jgi:site-specific DNA-methyltransferase (adenine-specific)
MTKYCIINGDCLDVLPRLPAQIADVVVTSPPYNLNIGYTSYNDNMPEGEYLRRMVSIFAEIGRSMKPDASLFLNVGWSSLKPWLSIELAGRLRELFVLQNRITWIKSITTDLGSTGQFKPINSERFLTQTTEDIFHFTLTGDVKLDRLAIGVPYADKTNLGRHNKSQPDPTVPKRDLRDRGNAWFIPYETAQNSAQKHNHPAGFPIELPRWCIKLCMGRRMLSSWTRSPAPAPPCSLHI